MAFDLQCSRLATTIMGRTQRFAGRVRIVEKNDYDVRVALSK